MKLRYIAMIALAALIGFSFVSCGDGDPAAESVKYTSVKGDNTYELTITSNTSKAYSPVKDDTYVLIIKITATGVQIGESRGTVQAVSDSGFTLSSGGATFTVTVSSGEMTAITVSGGGNIPGTNVPAPGTGMTDNSGGNQGSGSGGNSLADTTWEHSINSAELHFTGISEKVINEAGMPKVLTYKYEFADSTVKWTGYGYTLHFDVGDEWEEGWGVSEITDFRELTFTGTYTVTGDTVAMEIASWQPFTATINGDKLVCHYDSGDEAFTRK